MSLEDLVIDPDIASESGASVARENIVQQIRNMDVSKYDITPWLDRNKRIPLPKQSEFCNSKAKVTLYGGSAGSGKTDAIVLDQVRHINDPKFESITFRKNSSSLKGAGGIYNKAGELYMKMPGVTRTKSHQDLKYTFPSGATARYSHLDGGKDTAESNHAGLEYSAIYFDELHTFDRESFFFMMTRLRSNSEHESYVKACMNPCTRESTGGWIHEFLDGFFIDEYGYPIQENSGKIRYFISDEDGNLATADTAEELMIRFGVDCAPMSYTFISALIVDNPVLCKLKPEYIAALKNSGRVERERLLYGCWNVAPKGAGYFQREWITFIDRKEVPRLKKIIRCWDLASSIKSESNHDPDATACTLMGLGVDDNIYVIDALELYGRPSQVTDKIHWKAEADGKKVPVGIPQDPSAAGKVAYEHYSKPLILKGFKVKRMKTRKGKLERFQGFSNAAENGIVYIVKGDWNRKWIQQLEDFDPQRKRGHDDYVDTASDCYNWLVSGAVLPSKLNNFNPRALTKINRFNLNSRI